MRDDNPLWYKDAIIYELHIRSFFDSNADGIGDFPGLTKKLDYIKFLGVNTIWILPFYPSPLRDDGYDIADFTTVNPIYGTLNDFKHFLNEAHKRDIRVVTELVLNHTSSMHPWFQKSRMAKPNSRWRNYYVWSDTNSLYQDARIIFKDFETSNWTWDPVANAYYWHRFYSHQPDLNYDNPEVQKEVFKVLDFWFKLGVDGLRLDAVPYLYERDGTNCENLPETHAFLKKLHKYIEKHYKNRFILAEANQWPEDAISYFGNGDECHMAFHFPMMPRMYMSIQMEDRFPLIDILQQTPNIPANCQWATFLRNHDELTLEMVTDEERDYMYRAYAKEPQMRINLGIRRRLAPLMGGDIRKIKLMNGLLFSLPGTPIIYYGDEIGMGDNIYLGDRNGVRTPMQWNNADRNGGFSTATPQRLFLPVIIDPEYNYEIVNVELQTHNSQSLLWWMKQMIEVRKRLKAFSRGSLVFLFPENHKVLAFLRIYEEEHILVLINLSRYVQYAELDLSPYKGKALIELFGFTEFPVIGSSPYFFTLAPYTFLYFKIEPAKDKKNIMQEKFEPPSIRADEIFDEGFIFQIIPVLNDYLYNCRWFASKLEKIKSISINDKVPFIGKTYQAVCFILKVEFMEIETQSYVLPVAMVSEQLFDKLAKSSSKAIIAFVEDKTSKKYMLIDALHSPEFCEDFVKQFAKKKQVKSKNGLISLQSQKSFNRLVKQELEFSEIKPIQLEQSNTSVYFDQKVILKVFRRIENGINPDIEISRYLTEKTNFANSPRLLGSLEYHAQGPMATLGMIQEYIVNEGDAWNYTMDAIRIFVDKALATQMDEDKIQIPPQPFEHLIHDIPEDVYTLLESYVVSAQLLGTRTAELHLALGQETDEVNFKPEPFSSFDQRSLHQTIRTNWRKCSEKLHKKISVLDPNHSIELQQLLENSDLILPLLEPILAKKIGGKKIRCHGDYHLGQVLYTGKDFFIIDFEGEPERALTERKIKRSSLKDVAGMLRSFHYAVSTIIFEKCHQLPNQANLIKRWGQYWYRWSCHLFLQGYFGKMIGTDLLPKEQELILLLLKSYMLEKAIYELSYEMNNRPDWIKIPCVGLLELIGKSL